MTCHIDFLHGVKIPNDGSSILHLFYTDDDALFVGDWTSSNFANLARIKCFHAASGLKVNFHKSKVFDIGVSSNEVSSCARIIECEAASFPFKYLGVPVGAKMNLKQNCLPIIEKVQSKLSAWKAKHVSLGGRLTLVKSVIGSLPLFFFSLFMAPKFVIEHLEKIHRQGVFGPKDQGGFRVGSLESLNWALLYKWLWRFKRDSVFLWKQVTCGIHNKRKLIDGLAKKSTLGIWFIVVKVAHVVEEVGINVSSVFQIHVGFGNTALFLLDDWTGCGSLATRFLALFVLDKKKSCYIEERILNNRFVGAWNRIPSSYIEIEELRGLSGSTEEMVLSNESDIWKSKLSPNEIFPFMICVACIDRLPSAMTLVQRGPNGLEEAKFYNHSYESLTL
uniref:Reverse transcriptase domain-containing protein n=1 Tax=Lactuca sativa TaxID=4236 RepID=A0A9R1WIC1_LACSA|nr:hypothetical protein LSAT_V11C200080000 [Lactuca sativa]